MRTFLLTAMVAALGLSGVAPSHAYNDPWCVKANLGGGWVRDICEFRTFEHCREERNFYGPTAFCVHNPRYIPNFAPRRKRKF